MPVFLISGNNENGKRETRRVEADHSQDAVRECEEQGLTEIVLHNDDAGAVAAGLNPALIGGENSLTPADLVKFQYQSSFGLFLFLLKKLYWQLRWGFLCAIGFLFITWYNGSSLSTLEMAMFGLFLVPLPLAIWAAFFSSSRKYYRLMQAISWGRWQEVLDLAPRLRGVIDEFELSVQEASALARLGRFEEGLARVRKFEDSPKIPRWMYLSRLSEIYGGVDNQEKVIACMKCAYEDAPDNPTIQVDYAYALLGYQQDLQLAQKLLTDAKRQHLGEMLEILFPYFEGILYLNQGYLRDAESSFLSCLSRLLPIATSQPLLQVFVDLDRAFLAIVYAELGEWEEAQKIYKLVEPRLQALNVTTIMDRYADAMRK